MLSHCLVVTFLSLLSSLVNGRCYDPSPAFPLPTYSTSEIEDALGAISASIEHVISAEKYNRTSFSVEITSSQRTLGSFYHTAAIRNNMRSGVGTVDGDSVYRIASITKTFTTLGILQQVKRGNLSLDEPILKFIEELNGPQNGTIPWKDITLRSLASQLSGIPRECVAQSDLINKLRDPTSIGLPPATKKGLLSCDEYAGYDQACGRKEFLDSLKSKLPLFAPNQKSSYSNNNFNLLGLAIENVTGLSYSTYIENEIFKVIDMNRTSFVKPADSVAVLPILSSGDNYWDVEEGIQRPTGGIYSSASDLSKYLRYILTHYNGLTPAVNWFHPVSPSAGLNSFYGMPWEIYRTSKILKASERALTFVEKGGSLPGYYSNIIMVPDYDLGITLLVGGESSLLAELREIVTVSLVRAAEDLAWKQVRERYTGTYVATNTSLNSSITFSVSPEAGLTVSKFISNSTDVLTTLLASFVDPTISGKSWHAQVIPTLLFMDEKEQQGERWRILVVPQRSEEIGVGIWDEFCSTDDDPATYAGRALNELVFWSGRDGQVVEVELPAFMVTLRKQGTEKKDIEGLTRLVVQA